MILDAVICNHLSRSLFLSLSDAHTLTNRSAAARASPRASATAQETSQMHVVRAEGDGSSCAGCDGVANSGKVVDLCGVCDGGGIAAGTCNCAGDVLDQCGVCTKSADV